MRNTYIIEINSLARAYSFCVFNLMARNVIINLNVNNPLITTAIGDNTLASNCLSPCSVQLQKSCVCSEHLNSRTHTLFNPLTPSDLYISRTTPLTSKSCILYIYSTNVGTEYFKHALYSPFFALQNAVCFIMLTSLVPVLFTFYIQDVLKLKKNNSGAKGL